MSLTLAEEIFRWLFSEIFGIAFAASITVQAMPLSAPLLKPSKNPIWNDPLSSQCTKAVGSKTSNVYVNISSNLSNLHSAHQRGR
jgi:hypothetical protein